MRALFLFFALFSPVHATADPVRDLELRCWNSGGAENGTFLCEHVVITAHAQGELVVPGLLAPDHGAAQTFEQAHRACSLMGFRYAVRFELSQPAREAWQVTLAPTGPIGEIRRGQNAEIESVVCEP